MAGLCLLLLTRSGSRQEQLDNPQAQVTPIILKTEDKLKQLILVYGNKFSTEKQSHFEFVIIR